MIRTPFRTASRLACALSYLTATACAPSPDVPTNVASGHRGQAVVDVQQSAVERQTIGNCWIYACSGWAESLHLRAGSPDTLDISESYWTYMHWFLQLSGPAGAKSTEISTGGTFRDVVRIVRTYGLMNELDFIATDSADERAFSQSSALERMNLALAEGGALATPEDRADAAKVRQALDEAWQLSFAMRSALDTAFGPDLMRTFQQGATTDGTLIMRGQDIPVGYGGRTDRTLASALSEWREVGYSSWRKRETLRRVQRALHAREPVVMSWFVDFNALEEREDQPLYGSFNLQTLADNGEPGRQGGHMTVLEDYQARLHGKVATVVAETSVQSEVAQGAFEMISPAEMPSIHVEEGQTLRIAMAGTGDADLHVQTDKAPTKKEYLCRPFTLGSTEECSVDGPADVFVALGGYHSASVKLTFTTQVFTDSEQVLAAGVTLDPANASDAALLDAALDDSTEVEFLRIKNSWGAERRGLAMVQGFAKGYHDLSMAYLDGPITDVSECEEDEDREKCSRSRVPLNLFLLPPGY